jgi:hypothetical protein
MSLTRGTKATRRDPGKAGFRIDVEDDGDSDDPVRRAAHFYCRQVTARPTDRLLKTIERSRGPGGIM